MMSRLYLAMKESGGAPFIINESQAQEKNEQGFGIFRTVNSFEGGRKQENLIKILGWYADLDNGTKEEQLALIKSSPVYPSEIIETKRGFHIYFWGEFITQTDWKPVYMDIQKRIVKFFNADKNAKDVCRYLRAPDYLHLKDPKDPFMVKVYDKQPTSTYTESWMLAMFAPIKKTKKFEPVEYGGDCKTGLLKLSGSPSLNGDIISFKRNGNGTEQIHVNDKSTACWIDKDGLIGSHAGGGPQLKHWIMYYNYTWREALNILRGELGDEYKSISNSRRSSLQVESG